MFLIKKLTSNEILYLYNKIYVFRVPKKKKKKLYYTRNKVKALREIVPSDRIFDAIMRNTAIKMLGQIPEDIRETLVNKFGLRIEHNNTSDFSVILPL